MRRTYRGSCHCGAITFEADLDLSENSYRCNCSICRRTRFWAGIAREGDFRLLSGQDALTRYLFNTRRNEHWFCGHCGVRAFGIGTETPIGLMYGINLGCLDEVTDEELAKVPIVYVNGRDEIWDKPPPFYAHL